MLVDRVAGRYLDEAEHGRLREVLAGLPEHAREPFLEALWKPPIDQNKLLKAYKVKPADRQQVGRIARTLLLGRPSLLGSPEHLESLVEREMVAYLKVASERVLARFIERLPQE